MYSIIQVYRGNGSSFIAIMHCLQLLTDSYENDFEQTSRFFLVLVFCFLSRIFSSYGPIRSTNITLLCCFIRYKRSKTSEYNYKYMYLLKVGGVMYVYSPSHAPTACSPLVFLSPCIVNQCYTSPL